MARSLPATGSQVKNRRWILKHTIHGHRMLVQCSGGPLHRQLCHRRDGESLASGDVIFDVHIANSNGRMAADP